MTKRFFMKNAWAVMLLIVMGIAVSACSDDDEPAVLEGVKADASSYQLNEAGETTVEFTVSPANASIDNVALIGTDAFELIGKASVGNGKWTISLKANDFAKVTASNTVSLLVAQTSGAQKEITVNLEDPYSIDGKFALNHPRAFNFYGIEEGHTYETGLPVIVMAENGGNLATIKDLKIVNGVTTQKVGVDYFVAVKLENGLTGVELKVNPEKLNELKALVPTITTLQLYAVLTSNNGRIARLLLSAMTCAPEGTPVVDDQLTATAAEITDPDFLKTVSIDVTSKLKRIGVMGMGPGNGDIQIEDIGLFNEAGEKVTQESCMVLVGPDTEGKMICNFNLMGDNQYKLQPGTYTYVQRYHVTYGYGNGVKFQTVCADLKYQVIIK